MIFKKKSRHEFYVYHDGADVFARRGSEPPVLAETCESPQAAHDKVQEVVNPTGRPHDKWGPRGFHEEAFQAAISGNCKEYVEAAYAKR